jgi:putative transposase
MPQSLAQIYLHIVFSAKNREPLLTDDTRTNVHAYLAGVCKNHDSPALIIGGVEDHVHLLCRLSKTVAVATLIRELKRDSSKWIKEQSATRTDFSWQNGYAAFSVSPAHIEALKTYIARQADHHRTETFQEEFRRLCKKYDLELDERYAWD